MLKSDPEMKKMLKDHFPGAMQGKDEEPPAEDGGGDIAAQIMAEAAKLDEMAGEETAVGEEEGEKMKDEEAEGDGEEKMEGEEKERVYRLLSNFGDPAEMSASDKGLVGPANIKKMIVLWESMSPEERTECTKGGEMPMGAIASEGEPVAVMGKASRQE